MTSKAQQAALLQRVPHMTTEQLHHYVQLARLRHWDELPQLQEALEERQAADREALQARRPRCSLCGLVVAKRGRKVVHLTEEGEHVYVPHEPQPNREVNW